MGPLRFETFTLDIPGRLLKQGERQLALRRQPFKVLAYLAERPGRLVTNSELIKSCWDNPRLTSVNSLAQCIKAVREALGDSLVFAFRNFPLTEIHPHALHAALAAEAADRQGKFWEMHDLLFRRQNFLEDRELLGYAGLLGLDEDRFREDFEAETGLPRIESDVRSGEGNGVEGTPTIFVNGRHHRQGYDPATDSEGIRKLPGHSSPTDPPIAAGAWPPTHSPAATAVRAPVPPVYPFDSR